MMDLNDRLADAVCNDAPGHRIADILDAGASPEARITLRDDPQTAIFGAIEHDAIDALDALLRYGADPHQKADSLAAETPLTAALRRPNAHAAEILLAHGADPNQPDGLDTTTGVEAARSLDDPAIYKRLKTAGYDPYGPLQALLETVDPTQTNSPRLLSDHDCQKVPVFEALRDQRFNRHTDRRMFDAVFADFLKAPLSPQQREILHQQLLNEAVMLHDTYAVEQVLKTGVNPNAPDIYEPLLDRVARGKTGVGNHKEFDRLPVETVLRFIDHGADLTRAEDDIFIPVTYIGAIADKRPLEDLQKVLSYCGYEAHDIDDTPQDAETPLQTCIRKYSSHADQLGSESAHAKDMRAKIGYLLDIEKERKNGAQRSVIMNALPYLLMADDGGRGLRVAADHGAPAYRGAETPSSLFQTLFSYGTPDHVDELMRQGMPVSDLVEQLTRISFDIRKKNKHHGADLREHLARVIHEADTNVPSRSNGVQECEPDPDSAGPNFRPGMF